MMILEKIKDNISVILGSGAGYGMIANSWSTLLIESIEHLMTALITAISVTATTFFTKKLLERSAKDHKKRTKMSFLIEVKRKVFTPNSSLAVVCLSHLKRS